MKRLFTIACSIVMIYSTALAQTADAPLARVEQNKKVTSSSAVAENTLQVAEINETTNEPKASSAVYSAFKLPEKNSALESKVGPNGEDLFKKRNKYYYLDGTGKKVKVKSSELRDKPKTS